MKNSFKSILFLFVMTCTAFAGVNTDWDQSLDFAVYRTYSWAELKTPNSLWSKRIVAAIDQALQSKGWVPRAEGADVSIVALGTSSEKRTLETFYSGMGGGWGWRRFGATGTATTKVETNKVGTLIVDLFDANTKSLIWRGTATGTLSENPEKNVNKLNDAVKDMFKKFPPRAPKK
jgi:hypothetical protein